jgi:hypothetical protein
MKLSLRLSLLLLGLIAVGAKPAQAAVIDFTDRTAWSLVEGEWTFTSSTVYDGVKVTVATQGPSWLLTFNSGDAHAGCAAATGLSCDGDGLGVTDDEVTFGSLASGATDRITVSFSDATTTLPTTVNISQLRFLDLFGAGGPIGEPATETAQWAALSNGSLVEGNFSGVDTTSTLGYGTAIVNLQNVAIIQFFTTASLSPASNANSDFSLAAIDLAAVPEPATLALTGAGLAAVVRAARRRRRS